MVNNSANATVAQLAGTQEGEVLVPSYNWAALFAPHFRKLKNIKSYHHFYFDSSIPGVVHFKAASDSKEEMIVLQKNTVWCPTVGAQKKVTLNS